MNLNLTHPLHNDPHNDLHNDQVGTLDTYRAAKRFFQFFFKFEV